MTNQEPLSFDARACFIAGPDKSGTTLMCSLLDGHPNLAVFPEETNYMRTLLPRLGQKSRAEQINYLTRKGPSRGLFMPPSEFGNSYPGFPRGEYLENFVAAANAPQNQERDLLVMMIEELLCIQQRSEESVTRWVEKTPDNAYCFRRIASRFPQAKLIVMMRDPRGKFAAHLELMRKSDWPFSIFNTIRNWLQTAALLRSGDPFLENVLVVRFEDLLKDPESEMRKVAEFLEIPFHESLLSPTKAGELWGGNSSSLHSFREIDSRPAEKWKSVLGPREIAWVELHYKRDMERWGYEPMTSGKFFGGWFAKLPEERICSYLKSRWFLLSELITKRFSCAAENHPR